jgi:methyl-accepting chemotaxis protein
MLNYFKNMKIGAKLAGTFLFIGLIIIAISLIGFLSTRTMNENTNEIYSESSLAVESLYKMNTALFKIRGDVYLAIILPEKQAQIEQTVQTSIDDIEAAIQAYQASEQSKEEMEEFSQLFEAWSNYKEIVNKAVGYLKTGDSAATMKIISDPTTAEQRKVVDTALNALISEDIEEGQVAMLENNNTFIMANIAMITASVLGILLAIILGFLITRNIVRPLKKITAISRSIAEKDLPALAVVTTAISSGDLTQCVHLTTEKVDLDSHDEVGELAHSFNLMIDRLLQMSSACETMSSNLRSIVQKITNQANLLSESSNNLAVASEETGRATNQIANVLQQVTSGIAQQSEAISGTSLSVEKIKEIVEGVARGAQKQTGSVEKASSFTGQITNNILQVSENTLAVTSESGGATEAAKRGASIVEETLNSMEAIKSSVGVSAQKVAEMGQRSTQIGMIVETINDIASQTNMLALNAAIEAARAGEHGKGFAVVADEVRKLAERSSSATKEVGELVRTIQATVTEAVSAMNNGTSEVGAGSMRALQAGEALKEILRASDTVYRKAQQESQLVEHIKIASNDLVGSMDTVSAVVEENATATQLLASGVEEVTQSIQNIASVSEESSAALEEISANTEEMNAQVDQVALSAQSLAVCAPVN